MYILKLILISLHTAVILFKNFVKILLLYQNPSIRQFVANDAFQKLQNDRQAGCFKKLGINCTSRKSCPQNTVLRFDEIHIIYSKNMQILVKSTQKSIGELKKTDTKMQ